MYVYISNYGNLSRNLEKLELLFSERGIQYFKFEEAVTWRDLGNLECRNRESEELIVQFAKCGSDCYRFLNRQLHFCHRSSHGMDLGVVPEKEGNYIDLLDDTKNSAEMKERLRRFIYSRVLYVEACNYCNKGTDNQPEILGAVQLKNE